MATKKIFPELSESGQNSYEEKIINIKGTRSGPKLKDDTKKTFDL